MHPPFFFGRLLQNVLPHFKEQQPKNCNARASLHRLARLKFELTNKESSLRQDKLYCPGVNLRSGVRYIFYHGGKVRLIQLLDCLSVACPESGLFSDWSRNKKVLRIEP